MRYDQKRRSRCQLQYLESGYKLSVAICTGQRSDPVISQFYFQPGSSQQIGFSESLNNLLQQPGRHNLSLRVVYYIDYNNVKRLFKI